MKCALLLVVTCAVLIFYAECSSPPRCDDDCNRSTCPSTNECECGTELDMCGCCSYCLICPGKSCSFIANDRCTEGYECTRPEPVSGPDYFNNPGICTKAN